MRIIPFVELPKICPRLHVFKRSFQRVLIELTHRQGGIEESDQFVDLRNALQHEAKVAN